MTDKPPVHEALSAVMDDVRAVRKDSRNADQGYVFRGIDSVVNAVGPSLRKHGVVPVPMLEHASYRDVQTSRGKPSREVTVQVRYRFYGPAGDFIDTVVPGEAMDFGDKGTAKAMSVAMRIALLQALALPTDEPDADSQTYERAVPVNREAAPSPTKVLRQKISDLSSEKGWDVAEVSKYFVELYKVPSTSASEKQLSEFLDLLTADGLPVPAEAGAE
ncbi:ERF family protein [Prauserella endophytica]|uniref:Single-stranded DNA-binding protein n=1 Tax=Prauserella endophytica TaxID=1592324 RepID=A0ABY2S054_9PSEU|nr:ERF family protein [Prauserella endophytica]TKG67027.1 hypothetical protein FCN18_24280 [Prauserella endophytica]